MVDAEHAPSSQWAERPPVQYPGYRRKYPRPSPRIARCTASMKCLRPACKALRRRIRLGFGDRSEFRAPCLCAVFLDGRASARVAPNAMRIAADDIAVGGRFTKITDPAPLVDDRLGV